MKRVMYKRRERESCWKQDTGEGSDKGVRRGGGEGKGKVGAGVEEQWKHGLRLG